MRILHVIDHLGAGGAQTALANLVGAWGNVEDEIDVVGLGRQTELQHQFSATNHGSIKVLGRARWSLTAVRELAGVIQRGSYDLVHAHLYKSVMSLLWLQPRACHRLIAHIHATPLDSRRLFRETLKRWHRRADLLLTPSEHTRQAVVDFLQIAPERVGAIYNPASICEMNEESRGRRRRALRLQLGFEPQDFVVGFVGRLAWAKGLPHLLASVAELRAAGRRVGAVLIGAGPQAGDLRRQAIQRRLEREVRFVGFQSNPSDWHAAFDAAVFPSLTEALPLAPIEAMLNGLPVVASRVGGVPEIITDGQTGLLVPPGDARALIKAIGRLADWPIQPRSGKRLPNRLERRPVGNSTRSVSPARCGRLIATCCPHRRRSGRWHLSELLHDLRLIHRVLRLRRQLDAQLGWTADRLQAYQLQRVQQLVRHAYEHTRFYRRLYDEAGIHPDDIRSLEDFSRLPTVDKPLLRRAFPDEVVADTHRDGWLKRGSTGGSTGEPLRFVLDTETVAYKIAGNLRSMQMAGYRPFRDRLVQTSPDAGMVGSWARRLGNACLGRYCLNPFQRDWAAALQELRRFRPTVLVGWTSYLRTMADLLLQRGERLPVRMVLTTSEMLLPEDRRRIEQAFAAPLFDQYGSTEFGRVATEVPGQQGLIIHSDITLIESLDDEVTKQDGMGELVLTSLVNQAMPLIRYRIGDRGRLGTATDRYPAFPVLERIGGRMQDMLTRADGARIAPEFVHRILREVAQVEQYQVVQHSPRRVEIKLRLAAPLDADRQAAVQRQFQDQLGEMEIQLSTNANFPSHHRKRQLIVNSIT